MLRTLGQIFVTALTILSLILLTLWWRSHRTIDVLQLRWDHVNPQSVSAISNSGALHLEYTSLRPLIGLKASRGWTFSLRDGSGLSPEVRSTTSIARFASRSEFQIRIPLQDLFEDDARTRPIYQSQTIPLKILSIPFWFIVPLTCAIPLLSFVRWIRAPKHPRCPSRILWLLRRPALLATMATILLTMLWLRTRWRTDAIQWTTHYASCLIRSSGGQLTGVVTEVPKQYFEDPTTAPLQLNISDAFARANDWIIAPLGAGTEGIAVPFWLLVMLTSSAAVTLYLRQHLAPLYPAGHCTQCGYDLRASTGRCPECGAIGNEMPRRLPRKRITFTLWLGMLCLLMTAVLLVGWYRGRSQTIWLFRHDGAQRTFMITQGNELEFRTFRRNTVGGAVQYRVVPWYVAPCILAVIAAGCFWIARRSATSVTASTSPSAA